MAKSIISEIYRQKKLMGLITEATDGNPIIFLRNLIKSAADAGENSIERLFGKETADRLAAQEIKTLDDLQIKLGIRPDVPVGSEISTISKSLTDELIQSSTKKILTDTNLGWLAKDIMGDYFNMIGNPDMGNFMSKYFALDPKSPEFKKATDDLEYYFNIIFGPNDNDIKMWFRNYSEGKVVTTKTNVDVTPPKPDDVSPKTDTDDLTPPLSDSLEDVSNRVVSFDDGPPIPMEEFVPDDEAIIRMIDTGDPEPIGNQISQNIRKVAERFNLFKAQSPEIQEKIILEAQAQFIAAYNKNVKRGMEMIKGLTDDPNVMKKVETIWKDVNVGESIREKAIADAMKNLKVKYTGKNWQRWVYSFATWKEGATGRNLSNKEIFSKYCQTVLISCIIHTAYYITKGYIKGQNIGWDNVPGDNFFEKITYLVPFDEAFAKTVLPVVSHIALLFNVHPTEWFINEYRKPSDREIREKLNVDGKLSIKTQEAKSDNKEKEFSVGVIIGGIYYGDYSLDIKGEKKGELVKTRDGDQSWGSANIPSTGGTTMTREEVKAVAISQAVGAVEPLKFNPDKDGETKYEITDADGDTFYAERDSSGKIVVK